MRADRSSTRALRADGLGGHHGQLLVAALHARQPDSDHDRQTDQDRSRPQEIRAIRLSFGGGLESQPALAVLHLSRPTRSTATSASRSRSAAPVSSILRASVPWTIGLIGVSTIISFLVGTFCGRAAGLDPRFATGLAYPDGDVLSGGAVLLLGHCDAPGLCQRPPLVPGARRLQPEPVTRAGAGRSSRALLRYAELPLISIVLSSVAGWMLGMRNMMITMVGRGLRADGDRDGTAASARSSWRPPETRCCRASPTSHLAIGLVVSGALLVELVFNYPGVGDLLLERGLRARTIRLIQGIFLMHHLGRLGGEPHGRPRLPRARSTNENRGGAVKTLRVPRSPKVILGLIILGFFLFLTIIGPYLAPYTPTTPLSRRL